MRDMSNRMKIFGERLKQAREERGMTQGQLAYRAGIERANLNRYEHARILPRIDSLILLANELDCTTDYLCGLED